VTFTAAHARELVARLELDPHAIGICHACLCIVSFAIDKGDEREVRREVGAMAPWLWDEGLALPTRVALERARRAGIARADEAIADVDRRGARSPVVRAVVRRLGEELLRELRLPERAEVIPLRRRE
jgi:hypothetical protein